jgi:MFS family permease
MAGALFIWMADWYGRTWHMFFGCLGVCLATIVTALSINLPMLIAGRFFLSFFATCAHTAAPLYLVEITPAAYRGTLAGLYNTFYNVVGLNVLCAFICDKTDDSCRDRFSRHQLLMPVTNIWLSMATLIGGYLYGFRWSVLLWYACSSSFFLNRHDGKCDPMTCRLHRGAI